MTIDYIKARLRTCATPAATAHMVMGMMAEADREGYERGVRAMKDLAQEVYNSLDAANEQSLSDMQRNHENGIMIASRLNIG